jgi:hypothetical protein
MYHWHHGWGVQERHLLMSGKEKWVRREAGEVGRNYWIDDCCHDADGVHDAGAWEMEESTRRWLKVSAHCLTSRIPNGFA